MNVTSAPWTCTAALLASSWTWYVVPADHKWFTHIAVSSAIIQTLEDMDLQLPQVDKVRRKQLDAAKQTLLKSQD